MDKKAYEAQFLQKQADDLAQATYSDGETQRSAAAQFVSNAIPSIITFGIGAAVLTSVVAGVAAVFGIGGITAGAIIPAASAIGIGTAAISGFATGGLAAHKTVERIHDSNNAIHKQIETLQAQAVEEGAVITEKTTEKEPYNRAKDSPFIQQIIDKGKNTLSPTEILRRAAQDAGIVKDQSR